jgi:hypothetical protein
MSDNERDAHIRAIYSILIPIAILVFVSLFVSILSWNSIPGPERNNDAISWSLSVLQIVLALFAIMLGVVAVFGFWSIRGAAVASAKREARIYLDEKAASMFENARNTRGDSGRTESPKIPTSMNEKEVLALAEEELRDGEDSQ